MSTRESTTKPYRQHVVERLKTFEDAGSYLAASLSENADYPIAIGLAIEDIIAAFNLPLEVTVRRGDATLTAGNRDRAQEIILSTERALEEKLDGVTRHELVNRITVALNAAAPFPAPAESIDPSIKKLALEIAMLLDQIVRANVETTTAETQVSEDAVPALDCLVHGHSLKTEGNKISCGHRGTGVEFSSAPPERTRVAEEQSNVVVSVNVDVDKHGEIVFGDTRDSARRAAEEIVRRVYGGDKDEFGELEAIVAGIISKHSPHAAAPADNDAELLELLRTSAVLCISGDGQPRVSLLFKELKDAQAVHGWLVRLVYGMSTATTKGDR